MNEAAVELLVEAAQRWLKARQACIADVTPGTGDRLSAAEQNLVEATRALAIVKIPHEGKVT